VAGVDSDRLYPLSQQEELAAGIGTADGLRVIESPCGHDGFLSRWSRSPRSWRSSCPEPGARAGGAAPGAREFRAKLAA
jgi:homoserine O-acetyltransferase